MSPPYLGNCVCGQIVPADRRTAHVLCLPLHRLPAPLGSCAASVNVGTRESLELLEGRPLLISSIANDGRGRKNKICPACEIRLWSESVNRPKLAILRPGALEQAKEFIPIAHQFARSALPWFVFPSGIARYEGPAEPTELVRLWRETKAPKPSIGGT
jgi:hypothetical protein